ncbi:MAG TPA: LLM class F420-dependent oxidoreductase [Acidimicrobiales bacterium]|jgi:F420-dependent oxidoreductase-like protein|nr:LLM class F420-dependent oxidoreductase [Acidimicrobiales bacterium]
MKLALRLDLYRSARLEVPVEAVRRAEELGYHSVWTAEAYGTDALSPLAYLAALTTRIKLGTAVAQLAARPPATLAMHAMTIDGLAGGGRVIIGIGVSGPQIVEGWYGQPWGRPNARLRDYVTITRKVLDREEPVRHDGPELSLPYAGPGALGQGKALKSILHPASRIPIWLAAGGPRNTELCAELCDGWLPMGLGVEGVKGYDSSLHHGFSQRPAGRPDDFEIFEGCTVNITDDVAGALDAMRPLTAMYVGGMGSETHNYHRDSMARRGFPDVADRIGELWRAGRKQEAVAAVPDEYLELSALIGSPRRIREHWPSVVSPGVTGMIVGATQLEALDLMADLAGTRD